MDSFRISQFAWENMWWLIDGYGRKIVTGEGFFLIWYVCYFASSFFSRGRKEILPGIFMHGCPRQNKETARNIRFPTKRRKERKEKKKSKNIIKSKISVCCRKIVKRILLCLCKSASGSLSTTIIPAQIYNINHSKTSVLRREKGAFSSSPVFVFMCLQFPSLANGPTANTRAIIFFLPPKSVPFSFSPLPASFAAAARHERREDWRLLFAAGKNAENMFLK